MADRIEQAKRAVEAMSPEEREAMWEAQRQSWIRAFTTPCEHGELDFERCGECRIALKETNNEAG